MNEKSGTSVRGLPAGFRRASVSFRLSALIVGAAYALWRLAETWQGNQVILPALGVALGAFTLTYLVSRWRRKISRATVLTWSVPWAALTLTFFLGASAWHARTYEKELFARLAFDREVDTAQRKLAARVARYQELLNLSDPLVVQSSASSSLSSLRFLGNLIEARYPAIAALGIIEASPESDDGPLSYRFHPLAPSSGKCVRTSIEITADSGLLNAIEQANNTGFASTTRALQLDCGAGNQRYLIFLRPADERDNHWVAALLLPAQLLSPSWTNAEFEVDYAAFDGPLETEGAVLYWAGSPSPPEAGWLVRHVPLEIGGRTWTLKFQAKNSFPAVLEPDNQSRGPWRGVLFGVAVFGLTWSLGKRRISRGTLGLAADTHAQAAASHTTDGIIGIDETGTIQSLNPAAERLFGYSRDAIAGGNIFTLLNLPQTTDDPAKPDVTALCTNNWRGSKETIAHHHNGSEFPVDLRVGETDSSGERLYTLIVRDISSHKREQEQLQRLATFREHNPQPIIETDTSGHVTYINPEAARRFPELSELQNRHRLFQGLADAIESFQAGRERPVIQQFQVDSAAYEQHICYVPKGDFIRIYVFDITDRQQALEDPLTGLPNRKLFLGRLAQASKAAKHNPAYGFAVLFLDLDNFKNFNDTYGHMVADQLLKIVGRRLDSCLRPRDVVARLGGDEFTVLLDNVKNLQAVEAVACRIQERLSEPFELACHRFLTTASIGIALSSTPHNMPSDLLGFADAAMYRAKRLGRARFAVFNPRKDKPALTRLGPVEIS